LSKSTNIIDPLRTIIDSAFGGFRYRPPKSEIKRFKEELNSYHRFWIGAIPLCPGKRDGIWPHYIFNIIPDAVNSEQIRILAKFLSQTIVK